MKILMAIETFLNYKTKEWNISLIESSHLKYRIYKASEVKRADQKKKKSNKIIKNKKVVLRIRFFIGSLNLPRFINFIF